MPKPPTVYIFGAGATRGAFSKNRLPPPVDIDFFDIAKQLEGRGTPLLAKRVLKSVWELYGTSNIGLEQYYRDIETRELITSFAKTANQPKNWKRRREELEKLIRRVYVHTTCNLAKRPATPKVSSLHEKILAGLKPGDTILTFNYDTLIEESLPKEKPLWNPLDGYGVTVGGKGFNWHKKYTAEHKCPKNSQILILKLHGSLNWTLYSSNSKIRLKERPYVIRAKHDEKVSVLAPGWNKKVNQNPYKAFWRAARLRLEKCKSMVIIGYSMPETDLLAQALFSEVIRTRAERGFSINELHLIDPNFAVKDRFSKLFMPALGPYGKVFKYTSMREFTDKATIRFKVKKEI